MEKIETERQRERRSKLPTCNDRLCWVGEHVMGPIMPDMPYDIHAGVLKFSDGTVSNSGTAKPTNPLVANCY
jgi:hypothetical protein